MVEDKSLLSNKEDMGQVVGALLVNGELLYDSSYALDTKDFIREYALVFSCVNNLVRRGVRQFNDDMVLEYISTHFPSWKDVYKEMYPENDLVKNLQLSAKLFNLEYHYKNVKKMSYLRDLNDNKFDISEFYDVSGEDKALNREFDKSSIEDIRNKFKMKINSMDERWISNSSEDETLSSESVTDEMLDDALEGAVEVGHKFPIGLEVLTHIFRGQLPQKYHLNMGGSGVVKTRLKVLEAINNGCEYMWDDNSEDWTYIGESKPALFISTEVTTKSLLTMIIAIISGVEESKIKRRKCNAEEKKRVNKARKIFKSGKVHIEYMPNFTVDTIESCIEKYVLNKKIEFIYFDYIHASSNVIANIGKKTGNKGLGTDKVLEAFSIELKNICNKYMLNFATSCQVNRGSQGEDSKSFASVRGVR
ncbi:MAG: DnaB-like helicase C-terminal domain-containing protein [Sarcina sp.]